MRRVGYHSAEYWVELAVDVAAVAAAVVVASVTAAVVFDVVLLLVDEQVRHRLERCPQYHPLIR